MGGRRLRVRHSGLRGCRGGPTGSPKSVSCTDLGLLGASERRVFRGMDHSPRVGRSGAVPGASKRAGEVGYLQGYRRGTFTCLGLGRSTTESRRAQGSRRWGSDVESSVTRLVWGDRRSGTGATGTDTEGVVHDTAPGGRQGTDLGEGSTGTREAGREGRNRVEGGATSGSGPQGARRAPG